LGEVIEEFNKTESITVSLDASDIKDIRLFPIVVRNFLTNCGDQDKITDFVSLPFLPYKTKLLLCVQITRTPIFVAANVLAKIMCGENLKLN
jgi:hypothetical protein